MLISKALTVAPLVTLFALVSCSPRETPPPALLAPTLPIVGDSTPAVAATHCGNQRGTLAFASYRDGESEIYSMNADGAAVTRLTDNEERLSRPIWSPDAELIAYVVTDEQGNLDIYVMNADGSHQTRLTSELQVDTEPAWGPAGERIAFSSARDSFFTTDEYAYERVYGFEIYVMDTDGSGQTNLTNSPAWDTAPAWSPDGDQIAFQSNRDGNREIYLMESDGSSQVNLTKHQGDDAAPHWSPNGSKIAFHSDRTGVFNIFVMEADGSELVQLTDSPDWDIEPAWSPYGQHIAFYSKREGNFEVYVMNADGSC